MSLPRSLTPARIRILSLIAHHGKATRDLSQPYYVWKVDGQSHYAMSGPIDRMISDGFLTLSEDRTTATLSAKGREAITYVREAA